ncbi:Os04g0444000 [Oryza sativa Japonica Group]|uniref:Os04g0444000 protein n=1 Tax=Oryza sativa subsp. japonica TaxID=39947 RepID=A0A0P0WB54_ORYSJ|nr:Os04g0444000 [Oryza sativa Japonica Group]
MARISQSTYNNIISMQKERMAAMARDGQEVAAAAPSGGRHIRPPERRGSRASVRRSGGGRVRWPGRGSKSPDLVEAGSDGGCIRRSVWEALAAGSSFPEARSGV